MQVRHQLRMWAMSKNRINILDFAHSVSPRSLVLLACTKIGETNLSISLLKLLWSGLNFFLLYQKCKSSVFILSIYLGECDWLWIGIKLSVKHCVKWISKHIIQWCATLSSFNYLFNLRMYSTIMCTALFSPNQNRFYLGRIFGADWKDNAAILTFLILAHIPLV